MYVIATLCGCFSQTIDHVGERFCTPMLDEFISAWILLFSHSPKARLAWRIRTGHSIKLTPKQDGGVAGRLSIKLRKCLVIFRPFLRRMNWEHLPGVDCLQSCRILPRRSVVVDAGRQAGWQAGLYRVPTILKGMVRLFFTALSILKLHFTPFKFSTFPIQMLSFEKCVGQPAHVQHK